MIEYTKERPLRVFEAFAGYGSQMLALYRLMKAYPDFSAKCVGWAEFDPQSKQSIDRQPAVIAHKALHPDAGKNYGDIAKINWDEVPDFDLFTYSFPCFEAGTLVLTDSGYKRIEDVAVGDKVLTHTNNYRNVLTLMKRHYKGTTVKVYGMGTDIIHCTQDHPFYVRRMYRRGHKMERLFHEPEWIKAKNLDTSCYLGYAINTKSQLPKWNGSIDNRWGHGRIVNNLEHLIPQSCFWYLMGRYVGDGWKRTSEMNGSGIVISCSDRNKSSLESCLIKCGLHYSIVSERTAYKAHISMNELNVFVDRYGYYAYGKKVDQETLNLPVDLLKSFIEGYVDSDGYKTGNLIKVTSVSRELCFGIAQCVAKVYHRPFSIYRAVRNPKTVIEGRTVNQRDSYNVTWKESDGKQDKAFYEDGYIWYPITKLPLFTESELDVYNLSVEEDESYTANGAIVHNCTDISQAGLGKGFKEGSGTRSSMLWECEKAIKTKRPRYLMLENVKNLISKKFIGYYTKWLEILEGYGYANFTSVLNAKDFGVAQNRERVFCISILRTEKDPDPQYNFPEPFPLEKRLKDYLEPEVDEKYYVSDKLLEPFFEDEKEADTD